MWLSGMPAYTQVRVGQDHNYAVCIRYFGQGNHHIYGHIRCCSVYTVIYGVAVFIRCCSVYTHIRCCSVYTVIYGVAVFIRMYSVAVFIHGFG